MAREQDRIDTRIEIITPENIAFEYRVAGPFRRLPAYLVDSVIRAVLVVAAGIALGVTLGTIGAGGVAAGTALVVWFILAWFYGVLFEALWNGQTPGKRALRIRVLSIDGQPINWFQAMTRNLLRAADAQPVFIYSFGLISCLFNDRLQRLGDLAAGTMVVVEERVVAYGVARVENPDVAELAAELPSGFRVSPTLAQALSSYALRRSSFPWARRVEIVRPVVEPLLEQLGWPADTDPDLLMCALYHRVFFTRRTGDLPPVTVGESVKSMTSTQQV